MGKYLLALALTLILATPALAQALSIGFEKSSYLIAPNLNYQIFAELKGSDGQPIKASGPTQVFITPGSPTGQISSAISQPNFASPSATVRITISTGNFRRSFLYRDPTLGESVLTATSAALLNGTVKVTIGYPPPPPPPPPPASKPAKKPAGTVAVNVPTTLPTQPVPVAQVTSEELIEIESLDLEEILIGLPDEPAVLAVSEEEPFLLFWEILSYLKELLFAKIML